jgi:Sulfotransferase domain
MSAARKIYDQLPAGFRTQIRSLTPKELKRWYAHRKTDVYLISYPKCGRTWLRLMIGTAIAKHYSLPEDENTLFLHWKSKPHPQVPMITVIHDDRPMLKAAHELEASKERYRNKKVIFLSRDPRDVIVSSYFEMVKRGNLFGDNPYESRRAVFEGDLKEFIYRDVGGFDTILRYYNIWAENRTIPRDFLLVRYEDLKRDPQGELRRVLDFLGLQTISAATIQEAIDFSSFENMRKMEAEGRFQSGMLKPAEKNDQDSYKTRKGKVGGYADYLDGIEVKRINHKMQTDLSDFYGYQTQI